MNKYRYLLFALTAFLVLALSAVNVAPALADDGAPPPVEPAAEVEAPAGDAPVVAEAPSVEEPAPAEEVPAVEEPAAAEEVPPAEEPATLPEVLEQVPEGTEVVVVNEEGETVPLATEEAAQAIAGSDPWWCPGAGKPSNLATGMCTTGQGSGAHATFASLLTWMQANVGVGGTIWVEGAYDSAVAGDNDVVFDQANFTNPLAGNGSLTLNGGWDGNANGLGVINVNDHSVFNGDSLSFIWTGAITLNNIWIQLAATNASTAATFNADASALYVDTVGNVTLNNVYVTGADNAANNMIGGIIGTDGNVTLNSSSFEANESTGLKIFGNGANSAVTVNNSDFIGNGYDGLNVVTTGIVTANNIIAADNGNSGAVIDNTSAPAARSVVMKGYKHFIDNGADGLVVYTNGLINISNFVATGNGGNGVFIDNTYGADLTVPVYNGVTVLGNNLFEYNGGDGLDVYSYGAILVGNVTANGNGGAGAYLNNCIQDSWYDENGDLNFDDVPGDCLAKTAKPITVSGTNIFNDNEYGLTINSAGGAILLNNITASDNASQGLYADNMWTNAAGAYGTGAVTLNGYGIFNWNGGVGLEVYSVGNAAFKNVTANYNNEEGAYVEAWASGVAAPGVTFTGANNFNYNGQSTDGDPLTPDAYDGLFVDAEGAINVSSVAANGNSDSGAYLESDKGVTLTGVNVFMDNFEGDGLRIEAYGAVLLNNVAANDNGGDGAYIWNADGSLPANVTLNGVNVFKDNYGDGLYIGSRGVILVNNLTADGNTGNGAYLDNCLYDFFSDSLCATNAAPKPVTLIGPVNVSDNGSFGLYVDTIGAVLMGNVTARWNGWDTGSTGVYIVNNYNTAKQSNVTITGVNNFSENYWNGLQVYSYGVVTLNNIAANGNAWSGAIVDNAGGLLAKGFSLLGVNAFNYNGADGLKFMSDGNVILNRPTAINNDSDPLDGYDGSGITGESTNGTITLTCGFAYGNYDHGIYLDASSGKLVAVKGLYAWNNGTDYWFSLPKSVVGNCLLP